MINTKNRCVTDTAMRKQNIILKTHAAPLPGFYMPPESITLTYCRLVSKAVRYLPVGIEAGLVYFAKMKAFIKQKIIRTQDEWQSHIDNVFELIDRELVHFKPHNFLDVGCGRSDRTRLTADHFQIQSKYVYSVDCSHELVDQCREMFNAHQVELEAEDLPFDDGAFDLFVCNQVLEHLKNDQGAMKNIVRVTRPKGFILIGIPNLAHLINRLFLLFGIQPLCNRLRTSHVRGFTHSAFVQMFESIPDIKLISSAGALMYPLPFFLAKPMSAHFIGMSGYVSYLLQKL